jgi:hypothetical protein
LKRRLFESILFSSKCPEIKEGIRRNFTEKKEGDLWRESGMRERGFLRILKYAVNFVQKR